MEKKQRRVNWRGGLLYLLFVQIEVIEAREQVEIIE